MKATWNNRVLATSDETVVIEGNHYFPPGSVDMDYLEKSELQTVCSWKGTANYYHLVDGDTRVEDAAWYYPEPKEGSQERVKHTYKDYIAFYGNIVDIG